MPNLRRGMMAAAGVSTTTLYAIWGSGNNAAAYLGDGTTTNRSSPVQMGDKSDWTFFNANGTNAGAINSAGELWTWGYNNEGQLGLGDTTNRSSPTQVGSLTDWASVATSGGGDGRWMFAVKTDGTLWACGRGSSGNLGLGSLTSYSSPVQVGSLTDWLQVTTGGELTTHAIKTDGTLWGWGLNPDGQLGVGNTTTYCSPVQIGSATDWVSVRGGAYASTGMKNTDEIWTWGNNSHGTLGTGNVTNYSSPIQIAGAWAEHSESTGGSVMLVNTAGELWSCGQNNKGQLGLGTASASANCSFAQVGSLTDWLKISYGQLDGQANKTDGTMWFVGGDNEDGAAGQGNIISYSSPVQVGSYTDWRGIVSGGYGYIMATRTA